MRPLNENRDENRGYHRHFLSILYNRVTFNFVSKSYTWTNCINVARLFPFIFRRRVGSVEIFSSVGCVIDRKILALQSAQASLRRYIKFKRRAQHEIQ